MFNNPFEGKSYGMPFNEGDVVGVGYRHRTGTVFFTRNGRKIEDAYSGLRWNLFPTIGANGPCQVHVNLGQMGMRLELSVKLCILLCVNFCFILIWDSRICVY